MTLVSEFIVNSRPWTEAERQVGGGGGHNPGQRRCVLDQHSGREHCEKQPEFLSTSRTDRCIRDAHGVAGKDETDCGAGARERGAEGGHTQIIIWDRTKTDFVLCVRKSAEFRPGQGWGWGEMT